MGSGLLFWLYLADSLALGIQVNGRVAIGSIDAGVPEPVADGDQIHASLQKVDGGAMAHAVRMKTLACERR